MKENITKVIETGQNRIRSFPDKLCSLWSKILHIQIDLIYFVIKLPVKLKISENSVYYF